VKVSVNSRSESRVSKESRHFLPISIQMYNLDRNFDAL